MIWKMEGKQQPRAPDAFAAQVLSPHRNGSIRVCTISALPWGLPQLLQVLVQVHDLFL